MKLIKDKLDCFYNFPGLYNSLGNRLYNSLGNSLRNSLWNSLRLIGSVLFTYSLFSESKEDQMTTTKIEKFTPKMEEKVKLLMEKYKNIADSTERLDREKAKESVKNLYALIDLPEPRTVFCKSPFESIIAAKVDLLNKTPKDLTSKEIGQAYKLHKNFWFLDRINWTVTYNAARDVRVVYTKELNHGLDVWTSVLEHTGGFLPYDTVCYISERPISLKFDEEGRFHCENGPAIEYEDGFSINLVHGKKVKK